MNSAQVIVQSVGERFAQRDQNGVFNLCAKDIEWVVNGPPSLEKCRAFRTLPIMLSLVLLLAAVSIAEESVDPRSGRLPMVETDLAVAQGQLTSTDADARPAMPPPVSVLPPQSLESASAAEFPVPRRPAEPGTYETLRTTATRAEPSDSAEIVDQISSRTRLNVAGSQGDWLVVYSKTRNRTVYVKRDDAMLISERTATRQPVMDSEAQWREVERQIQEAISRRGLTGVAVSFIGDTAYLKGTVQTDAQRFTAEQAARSFPEVVHVFNGIWVNP